MNLHGVRKTYYFVEESPYLNPGTPSIVHVDGVEVASSGILQAWYTKDGKSEGQGQAYEHNGDSTRLAVSPPFAIKSGTYEVRVLGRKKDGAASIAIPIEGLVTISPSVP